MEFSVFQPLCPYSGYAYPYRDDHTRMEAVCHKKDRRPQNGSWSICDEAHCPYFGLKISGRNAMIFDSSGAKLGEFKEINMTAVLQPEDYE